MIKTTQLTQVNHPTLTAAPPTLTLINFKRAEMVEMVEYLFSSSSMYDKIVHACKKYNQPLQRIVTLKNKVSAIMKSEKHNPFDLNRTEYAELLGVSPNCIRMRLRQKKLEGQYIFENGKYLFKAPEAVRGYIGNTTGQKTTTIKVYRRGNHLKGRYPNEAFRKHNEIKMLAALKHNVDDETQSLLPEAIEIAKQKKLERLRSVQGHGQSRPMPETRSRVKDYGIRIINESNNGYFDTMNPFAHRSTPHKFLPTNRGKKINKKGPYEI